MFKAAALSRRTTPAIFFVFHPSRHQVLSLPRPKPPADQTLLSLLQRCSSMKRLKQLHGQLITNDLLSDAPTLGKLIAFCCVSDDGDLRYGRRVFDLVPRPNTFMWNSLIRGYSYSRDPREALVLHRRMLRCGLLPNQFTLPFVLKSCASELASTEASLVHALIFKLGFESQVFVANALLSAYSSCGFIGLARKVFDEIPNRNVVSWNSIISGYAQAGDCVEAFNMFRAMRNSNVESDGFTLVSLLSACAQAGNLGLGRVAHHYVVITGVSVDLIAANALLDMYGKCGELFVAQKCFNRMALRNVVSWTSMVCAFAKHGLLDVARSWFDQIPERNVVSWNAMISCYVQHGLFREGLNLYTHMQSSRVIPDEVTLVAVLSACSQTGDLVTGKEIHEDMTERITKPSVTLFNSLVDMYAKCGSVDIALDIFRVMPEKTVVSWNVIIGAFAIHGCAFDAIELFRQMICEGFSPDTITFTRLLCACSHGGLLEVGKYYFEAMSIDYKVPYEIEHYACMVDLLGRGGQIEQAVELIRSMPMKPDIVIWGALLGACRIHGNMKTGEEVMKQLLELESDSGGLYVLVSNMYSERHRWEDMKKIREHMKKSQIKKCRAISSIEINGNINEFLVEDMRHENSCDIYCLLQTLTDHLISAGYPSVPLGVIKEQPVSFALTKYMSIAGNDEMAKSREYHLRDSVTCCLMELENKCHVTCNLEHMFSDST
ncbi:hypothetical protein C4D60_Mb09t20680 [Musa balbisiana]|uniref:DYW domain-containing protein n=1 Tax=Musa balbisiana TaxID=52838 RepID=A0A4S8IHY0_MUSBA|nr:hypothetical protein C4D60_Mb09t20680 [Musa balbisiana]